MSKTMHPSCSIVYFLIGAGALIGPTIGGTLWRITHRQTMTLIEARDREFYQRIQKNRVDPTAQSATNPVPDFYGAFDAVKITIRSVGTNIPGVRRKDWFASSVQTGSIASSVALF
jgi:hypothetical protein